MEVDVAIVGGGWVGSILARVLSKKKIKSVVIEKNKKKQFKDERGIALSLNSLEFLERNNIKIKEKFPIRNIHVSEQGKFGCINLEASDYSLEQFGAVVAGEELTSAVEFEDTIYQAEIKSIEKKDKNWHLQLEDKEIISKYLVAADGVNSKIRQQQNINVDEYDYQATAIVCNIQTQDTVLTAFERFVDIGTVAILPFGENRVKCVFSVENEYLNFYKNCSDEQYAKAIEGFLSGRIKTNSNISKRVTFPLKKIVSHQFVKDNLVLIGNAASFINPVAAQGLNLAIQDIQSIINSFYDLEKYKKSRNFEREKTIFLSDKIATLFASKNIGKKIFRNFGIVLAGLFSADNDYLVNWGTGK